LVIGRSFAHPSEMFAALARVRGHLMAKAALEMAAWDLYARQEGVPLWQALGGSGRPVASGVSMASRTRSTSSSSACGRARGRLPADQDQDQAGWDVKAVERVRSAFGDIPLMVDANAAYSRADAAHLAALDQFGLMMIEQPLEYDDWLDHAALQAWIRTPVCLDESITSPRIAELAIEAGRAGS
jgi:O-succinylbenzoate synthase